MITILKQNKIDRQKTMSAKEKKTDNIKFNEEISKIKEEMDKRKQKEKEENERINSEKMFQQDETERK